MNMDTPRFDLESEKSQQKIAVYGKSAIAALDDSYAKVAAWFLGPKAENQELLMTLLIRSMDNYANMRRSYYEDDPEYITEYIKSLDSYGDAKGRMESALDELMIRLHKSVPFFSPRYQAHMNWDTVLPGSLGYMAAILYNQNNVATEGGPATSSLEMEVGKQLCEMLGFGNISWGHITADGTIANLEAMWMARNLKFYPHAIQSMLNNSTDKGIIMGKDKVLVECGPEKIKLIDLNSWQLLNLKGDLIVELPGIVGEKCFPEMDPDARMKKVGDLLGPYLIQNMGLLDFAKQHRDINGVRVFVPATKHYSWPKAGTILGIGQESIVGVDVNELCQMDPVSLRKELMFCARQKIPVLMVVAVIGSTEEGAIDDLSEILNIRDELNSECGMWFNVHCDAAWGGYLASMISDDRDKMVLYADEGGFVPVLPLSKHAHKQLFNIRKADTVTIDPHKAGFIPYPAGAFCYRNKAMRELITFNAAYIHSNPDTNMGIYGVEGSKPGAAAAAVWLAHQSIPLNKEGYGRILGECMFSAKIYYCYWLTLAGNTDNFRIEPIVPLPELVFDANGLLLAEGDDQIKEFIWENILGKPNEDIADNPNAMAVLSQLGSDVLTNSFVVNFMDKDGNWNADLEKCKELNINLFNKFSIVDDTTEDDRKKVELVLTLSEIDSKHYNVALKSVCEKLGLGYDSISDYSLNFLINTILDPWPTTHDYVKKITGSFRDGIYECIGKMEKERPKDDTSAISATRALPEPDDLVKRIPRDLTCKKSLNLPVKSYAGYVTVDKDKENHLFYWFFESQEREDDIAETPLIIWLNGGPGASSLAGLFLENGPIHIRNDGSGTIIPNLDSWNKEAHLLYWDQPVGAGFSYTDKHGYVNDENELSEQFYIGLQGFFKKHPEYRSCPLYITGESYAGKYIPFIAKKIGEKNEKTIDNPFQHINLQGLAIGDGWMNPKLQTHDQIEYGYCMGFIDTKQRKIVEGIYREFVDCLEKKDMKGAFEKGCKVSDTICKCGGHPNIYDVRRWTDAPLDDLKRYLDLPELKKAIHVHPDFKWQFADSSGPVAEHLMNDLMADMTDILPDLVNKYRMLMYTGNFDMSCGFTGTEEILIKMEWKGKSKWRDLDRKVWIKKDAGTAKIMGYVKATDDGKLMQIVIPNAGHLVPLDMPDVSRDMIFNWLYMREFPTQEEQVQKMPVQCD
jgi:vitellogenic carboxypeptidase-like protein